MRLTVHPEDHNKFKLTAPIKDILAIYEEGRSDSDRYYSPSPKLSAAEKAAMVDITAALLVEIRNDNPTANCGMGELCLPKISAHQDPINQTSPPDYAAVHGEGAELLNKLYRSGIQYAPLTRYFRDVEPEDLLKYVPGRMHAWLGNRNRAVWVLSDNVTHPRYLAGDQHVPWTFLIKIMRLAAKNGAKTGTFYESPVFINPNYYRAQTSGGSPGNSSGSSLIQHWLWVPAAADSYTLGYPDTDEFKARAKKMFGQYTGSVDSFMKYHYLPDEVGPQKEQRRVDKRKEK